MFARFLCLLNLPCPVVWPSFYQNRSESRHRGALHVRHGATQNQIFALRHLHEVHEARMVLRAVPQMLEVSYSIGFV